MIDLVEHTRVYFYFYNIRLIMFLLFYKLDVDECKEDTEGILCPDNSKCINLDPQEDPRGFRCECHNGKPPVNRECDSKSKTNFRKDSLKQK